MKKTRDRKNMFHQLIALLTIALATGSWANEPTYLRIKSEISLPETKQSSSSTSHLMVGSKIDHVLSPVKGGPEVKITIAPTSVKDKVLEVDVFLSVKRLVNAKENRFEHHNYARKFNLKFDEVASAAAIDGVLHSFTATQITESTFQAAMNQGLKQTQNEK